jgi:hypothetical protein
MKPFKLFLAIVITVFFVKGLRGQCTGGLTVNVTGSSTGGNVTTAITTQPSNQSAALNGSFTLTVVATGANLTYQWKKGGVDIPTNGTSASYTKASATLGDADSYTVVVHGDCGTDVTSTAAIVTLTGVKLNLKVVLEGAYNSGTGMMEDGLRSGGLQM